MTHLTQLELSMYADDALNEAERANVHAHLENCPHCQAACSALQQEVRVLQNALREDTPPDMKIPEFKRPISLKGFAMANIATGIVIWLTQFLWKTLFGELVVNAAAKITSIYVPDAYEIANATLLYLLKEGTAMFDTYQTYVFVCIVMITLLGAAFMWRRSKAVLGLCLIVGTAGIMVTPTTAVALDLRQSEGVITIPATETVNDTLLLAAETIRVEGTITGDLIAVGQSINIAGNIGGNLIVFGESIEVRGAVNGSIVGGGSAFIMDDAIVSNNLWVGGERITVDSGSSVGQNAVVATRRLTMDGAVGLDLYAFGESIEVRGSVDGDFNSFANQTRLLGNANIAGDLSWHSSNPEGFQQDNTTNVSGAIEAKTPPEALVPENKYLTAEFYLWEAAKLISAFIVALAILWLAPSLKSLSLGSAGESLKSAGVGLLSIISMPILGVISAITLIGLPFTFAIVVAWLAGLYLASILIGIIVGQLLISDGSHQTIGLFAGLASVAIAVNIPLIGEVLSFIFSVLGFGLLVQFCLRKVTAP